MSATDEIFRLIQLANHPETDGEHFRVFMESARNRIEDLEKQGIDCRTAQRHLRTTREALQWILENHHEGAGEFEGRVYAALVATMPPEE